jgi:hypothetical protein
VADAAEEDAKWERRARVEVDKASLNIESISTRFAKRKEGVWKGSERERDNKETTMWWWWWCERGRAK